MASRCEWRESQVCILTPEGELQEVRIATTRERFRAVLGGRPRAKVLVESSTESEWVARCLEELGHEVIVADPGFAPMYLKDKDSRVVPILDALAPVLRTWKLETGGEGLLCPPLRSDGGKIDKGTAEAEMPEPPCKPGSLSQADIARPSATVHAISTGYAAFLTRY